MTHADLDCLAELEAAATKGPWKDVYENIASHGNPADLLRIEDNNTFLIRLRNAAKDLIRLARKGLEAEVVIASAERAMRETVAFHRAFRTGFMDSKNGILQWLEDNGGTDAH